MAEIVLRTTSSHTPQTLPGKPGARALASVHAFEAFWGLAAGLCFLAACFAAVYLVTY